MNNQPAIAYAATLDGYMIRAYQLFRQAYGPTLPGQPAPFVAVAWIDHKWHVFGPAADDLYSAGFLEWYSDDYASVWQTWDGIVHAEVISHGVMARDGLPFIDRWCKRNNWEPVHAWAYSDDPDNAFDLHDMLDEGVDPWTIFFDYDGPSVCDLRNLNN